MKLRHGSLQSFTTTDRRLGLDGGFDDGPRPNEQTKEDTGI